MAKSWDKARRSTKLIDRDLDAEFEQFLDESLSDESQQHHAPVASDISPRKSKSFNPKRRPWWDDNDDGDNENGMSDVVKRLMKSKSAPAVETSNVQPQYVSVLDKQQPFATSISRDSLEGSHAAGELNFKESGDDNSQNSESNSIHDDNITSNKSSPDTTKSLPLQPIAVGADTLDEIQDKMKFFQDLYGDQTGTLDFGKLNKQIDTELTLKHQGTDVTTQENSDSNNVVGKYLESQSQSEPTENSEPISYSDNRFEDIDSSQKTNFDDSANDNSQDNTNTDADKDILKEDSEHNDERTEFERQTTMLSKVSLMDSLDSITGAEFAAQRQKLLKAKQKSRLGATEEELHSESESENAETSTSNSLAQGTSTLAELTNLQIALADASKLPMEGSATMSMLVEEDNKDVDQMEGMTLTKTEHGHAKSKGFDDKAPSANIHIEVEMPRILTAADSSASDELHPSDDNESKNSNNLPQLLDADTLKSSSEDEKIPTTPQDAPLDNENELRGFALEPIYRSSDEDSPPTDSLRSIKEIANARRAEAIKAIQERLIKEQTPKKRKGSNIPRAKHTPRKAETPSKVKGSALRTSTPNSKSPGKKLHITRSSLSTSSNNNKKPKTPQTKKTTKSTTKQESKYMKTYTKRDLSSDLQKASHTVDNHENEVSRNVSISLKRELELQSRLQEMQVKLNQFETVEKDLLQKLDATNSSWQNRLETQRINFAEKCKDLEQELFILRSKLNHAPSTKDATRDSDGDKALMQTLDEQEVLLRGYQQESERLCSEMKQIQEDRKQTESKMFAENQKYASEIAHLKEKLEDFEAQRRHAPLDDDGSAAFASKKAAQFENQIKYYKDKEAELQNEISFLQGENDVLHRRIKLLEKDRVGLLESDVKKQLSDLEAKHQQNICRLQKKLTWYAKNQELLDTNQDLLTRKTDEIVELQNKLDAMQIMNKSDKELEKNKSKENSAKEKQIKDLERQVKEMEKIICQRHPNSLPALIFAASESQITNKSEQDKIEDTQQKKYLEKQVTKLQNQLEEKDNELLMKIRTMEQKYNSMTLQYQEHVEHLEQQLKTNKSVEIKTFEIPDTVSSSNNNKSMCKKCGVDVNKSEDGNILSRQRRKPFEDSTKDDEISELKRAVRALQEDRESRFAKSFDQKQISSKENKESELPKHVVNQLKTLSLEKDQLRDELEHSRLQNIKLNENHQAELAARDLEIETSSKRIQKNIEKLEKQHIAQLERLKVDFALEHSSSKVAELSGKLASQDVVVQHLQKKISTMADLEDAAMVAKAREEDLRQQISHLQDQLSEAECCLSPEMQDFKQLKSKIMALERRHAEREKNLQELMNNKVSVSVDSRLKEDKLKQALKAKADEVEHFREQLDSILQVLNELKRQGVVLPFSPT